MSTIYQLFINFSLIIACCCLPSSKHCDCNVFLCYVNEVAFLRPFTVTTSDLRAQHFGVLRGGGTGEENIKAVGSDLTKKRTERAKIKIHFLSAPNNGSGQKWRPLSIFFLFLFSTDSSSFESIPTAPRSLKSQQQSPSTRSIHNQLKFSSKS